MPNYLHRTTKAYEVSIPTSRLSEPVANYIQDPDLSAVAGFSNIYWTITGDVVTLKSVSERASADAVLLEGRRDNIANQVDQTEEILRASLLVLLDELNLHAARVTDILNAIDNASSLAGLKTAIALIPDVPTRSIGQMKTAIRGKFGS